MTYVNTALTRAGFLLIAAVSGVFAVSSGAPEGVSGAPGDSSCTSCHGGSVNSGPGNVRIDFAAGSYTPGQKSRVKVIVEDPNAARWGFQLTARPESNPQTKAGVLESSDSQTQVLRQGVLEWITHTAAGTRRGTRNTVTFEFDWTPASAEAGPVVLYAAANAANGDGTNSGDRIYTTSLTVTASAPADRPVFLSENVVDAWTATTGIAPGAWVTLTGKDLAKQEVNWAPSSSRPLDTKLGGVTVKVNDIPAALSFVSPTKITLLVPAATPEGDVAMVVERDGTASDPVTVTSRAALPAIHSVADSKAEAPRFFAAVAAAGAGTGLGLINSRGWVLGKPEADNRAARGVFPGEEIDIYAIGLGRTEGDLVTDRLISGGFKLASPVAVRFGDIGVEPSAALLVSPGLYIVRVKVPDTLTAGDVPVVLEVSGRSSHVNVLLNIQAAQ